MTWNSTLDSRLQRAQNSFCDCLRLTILSKLQSAVYTPEGLDQQLTASAQQFINDPTRNRFDRQRRIAYLSKIFDWFSEDFINHSGSLLGYVAQFVSGPELANDISQNSYSIEFLDYNWSLNGVPPLSHK